LIFTATLAQATDTSWTGTTSTAWNTPTNWSTGAKPGTTDNAVFNGTFSNQPNLTASTTAGGLWMTGSVGQNVTISGSTLTLQGNTINGTAGLGILVDNANAFTLTINAPLTLAGSFALTKVGVGALTLSKANTFSGGVTLNAGTVSISSDASLGASSGSLTFGGGTLQAMNNVVGSRSEKEPECAME
jgi:fibronectin-binding autotransporter adhesin